MRTRVEHQRWSVTSARLAISMNRSPVLRFHAAGVKSARSKRCFVCLTSWATPAVDLSAPPLGCRMECNTEKQTKEKAQNREGEKQKNREHWGCAGAALLPVMHVLLRMDMEVCYFLRVARVDVVRDWSIVSMLYQF